MGIPLGFPQVISQGSPQGIRPETPLDSLETTFFDMVWECFGVDLG